MWISIILPRFSIFNYQLSSSVLSRRTSVRDLGDTFDSKFAFDIHIGTTIVFVKFIEYL